MTLTPSAPTRSLSPSLLWRRLALPESAALLAFVATSGTGCETRCSCEEESCGRPECVETTTSSAAECGNPCVVTVLSDGTFDPQEVVIHNGDQVVWQLSAWTDSIIPADGSGGFPDICDAVKAYAEGDLTG